MNGLATIPVPTDDPSILPPFSTIGDLIDIVLQGTITIDLPPDPKPAGPVPQFKSPPTTCAVASLDPNDKYGSVGSGTARYIRGTDLSPYTVVFENKADATAAAQEIIVTDQLDVSRLDLTTFGLGMIAFGSRQVTVPPGRKQYTTDVDLRPASNLIVRINAGLDLTTGLVL